MTPTTPATHHLTTDTLAPAERPAAWHDWVSTAFGGLDSDLYGDTEFTGQLRTAQAGAVILTRLEADRHRVRRTDRQAREADEAYLKIVAPLQGHAVVEQHQRQAIVEPGAWSIYDTTTRYTVSNPSRVEHLIVRLPRSHLAERGIALDTLMARRLGAEGVSRMALEAMRSAWRELPGLAAPAARGVGEVLEQLVQLSLLELAGHGTAVTQREAFRDRVKRHIVRHLRDPALNAEHIAEALRCSRRHVYNALDGEDAGVAGYILALRLDAVRAELRHPARAAESITAIALDWGFANAAHFSRVFSERYGLPPSQYRRGDTAGRLAGAAAQAG